jgi:TrmH family RNA methyltransferase
VSSLSPAFRHAINQLPTVLSATNERVKQLATLKQPKARQAAKLLLVEGWHALQEAYASGLPLKQLWLNQSKCEVGPALEAAMAWLPATTWSGGTATPTQVLWGHEAVMKKLSDTATLPPVVGVFAFDSNAQRLEAEAVSRTLTLKPHHLSARLLVLDGLQDPGNVGTLLRSAVAFGVQAVLLCGPCVDVYGAKVVRASTGLVFRLPLFSVQGPLTTTLAGLQTLGWQPWLSSSHTPPAGPPAHTHTTVPLNQPLALALGHEGQGLQLNHAEDWATWPCTYIPMAAGVESLNVAQCGAIFLSQFYSP